MNTQYVFWTSVRPNLLYKTVVQGTLFAGCGALSLLLAGTLMPLETLSIWGLWIFLLAAGIMVIGLVPYRLLQKLEVNPYKIYLTEDNVLHYFKKGKVLLSLPISDIQNLTWEDRTYLYGIKAHLKNEKSLFFPFFSKRSYEELKEILL
ncbi:Uncharacterized protein PHSC3_001539 [Chlamydiales bacterium STE3]|nr:Uncharacterized protein PHSC3_001539 [Chlamydiales bacterium STE3]